MKKAKRDLYVESKYRYPNASSHVPETYGGTEHWLFWPFVLSFMLGCYGVGFTAGGILWFVPLLVGLVGALWVS